MFKIPPGDETDQINWVSRYLLTGDVCHDFPSHGYAIDTLLRRAPSPATERRILANIKKRLSVMGLSMKPELLTWEAMQEMVPVLRSMVVDDGGGICESAHAIAEGVANLAAAGRSIDRSSRRMRCIYCWRPMAETSRHYCGLHRSNDAEYQKRHRSYRRERLRIQKCMIDINYRFNTLARLRNVIEIDANGFLCIDGSFLDDMRGYWPHVAHYASFTEGELIEDILEKVTGLPAEEALVFATSLFDGYWNYLNYVEACMTVFEETGNRQNRQGQSDPEKHALTDGQIAHARERRKEGKTLQQIATELGCCVSTVWRHV